jgi:diaminopimelate epimerase
VARVIPFLKMNGLGNDFVVIDERAEPAGLSLERVRALGDRRSGIGFDQMLLIAPGTVGTDATMRVINADGSEVEACGNGARCVVALLLDESGGETVRLGSRGGLMEGRRAGDAIAIDMGVPCFEAAAIPLAPGHDPLALTFAEPDLARYGPAVAVSVGNPHAVFFVDEVDAVPLETVGPRLETHPVFPEKANISFVTVESPDRVRVRVWERGAGATLACGTAACAVAAAGLKAGRTGETVEVRLPGGPLTIALAGGRIVMTGPAERDWAGVITADGFRRTEPAVA